jgi:hypothetical protein
MNHLRKWREKQVHSLRPLEKLVLSLSPLPNAFSLPISSLIELASITVMLAWILRYVRHQANPEEAGWLPFIGQGDFSSAREPNSSAIHPLA